jgi:ABC-type amino acid transport substrate-binding protein/ABC-type amino acid transport system permease subunit
LALLLLAAAPAWSQDKNSPDAALEQLLKEARANCAQPTDRLSKVLCGSRIRIGVRDYYPLFSTREGDERSGYEVDVAHAIAKRLGVEVDFHRVNAATRIPMLGEDRVDLVIATMGHNTQRDGQVRFIRPHYYQSETTVVGPKSLPIKGWSDVSGRTICVTIGNVSNAVIVSENVRLMLFDEAGVLPERLRDETCVLAAQDDSFFAEYFTDPKFAAEFEQKFGFAQVPWGMAVARTGSDKLARALDLMSQIFHRDGVFLDFARKERIATAFLEKEHAVWQRPECNTDTGSSNPACVLPALNAELKPTSFAESVLAFEAWAESRLGLDVTLPMLTIAPAFTMFLDGVVNSLILIAGALIATLGLALVFGAAMGSSSRLLHWSARAITIVLQSSPIVLTLVIAAALAHAIFPYSASVAIGAAILALGLTNGSNAGQAISEATTSLRGERHLGGRNLFLHSLGRSATQIVAFLVNAAKGTPVASFVGAPELLSALTDITSFSSGRVTTYCVLLIFYTAVVMGVVWLCNRLRSFLEHNEATA